MRVSLSWISALLARSLPVSVGELQARLSTRVVEIESDLEHVGPNLAGVVVGKVLSCAQHPNADRLRLTVVDVGGPEALPIVCGAPNVAAGQTVAVATIGTIVTVPGKDGQPTTITIKAGKLRGEPSHGMICAADELGLPGGHDGILVLDDGLKIGTPLAQALGIGDTVMVVENHALTHRPDLWGQLGWAREVAVLLDLPAPAEPDTTWTDLDPGAGVALNDPSCLAYAGAVVEGVSDGPSPAWLVDRLAAVGVRSLGRLVDVTNYVCHELGQPMHAFDLREIGPGLCVRAASEGEILATLDGKSHTLRAGDLLIADARRPLALAGIMGGAASAVGGTTTSILLEAACFAPERIRKTRKAVGTTTDSSARFEKGLPPELLPAAIHRAVALLAELCPGCRVVRRFHAGALTLPERLIPLDPGLVAKLTGLEVLQERQAAILATLGFVSTPAGWRVPWWRRKDASVPAELVEEIGRHTGFHQIVPAVPRLPAAAPVRHALRDAEHRARQVLSAHGWDEVATYAFTHDAWATALAWAAPVRLANPLSQEQTVLRASLLPTLAEAVSRNRRHFATVEIYEVGKRYGVGIGRGEFPDETVVVAGAVCAGETPVYAARDAALALLTGLGWTATSSVRSEPHPELAPGRALDLWANGKRAGIAGEIPKALRRQAGLEDRLGWFCIDLETILAQLGPAKPVIHATPSRFPGVDREFTWICPEALAWGDLAAAAQRGGGDLVKAVRLLTTYRGAPYQAGEKAISVAVTLQADDRTLDEKDLVGAQARITQAVEKRLGVKLRA